MYVSIFYLCHIGMLWHWGNYFSVLFYFLSVKFSLYVKHASTFGIIS